MKVHHIAYLVKKIEKSICKLELLGYIRETEIIYDEYRDVEIIFMVNGGYRVELVSPKSKRSIVYNLLKKYKNTPYHMCYHTNNFEDDLEKLHKSGFISIDKLTPAPAIEGKNVIFLVNNSIGMIELLVD